MVKKVVPCAACGLYLEIEITEEQNTVAEAMGFIGWHSDPKCIDRIKEIRPEWLDSAGNLLKADKREEIEWQKVQPS